jgi:DNA-binding response OmpR family regulator
LVPDQDMHHVFRRGKLLVVDDEPSLRDSLREILEQEGHQVSTAESGEEALAILSVDAFDLILLDLKMKGIDGLEVMREAKEARPDAIVIMLTAYGTLDSAIAALRHGAHDYLLKPCSVGEIVASVDRGLAERWESLRRRQLVSSIEQSVRQLTATTPPPEPTAEIRRRGRFIRARQLLMDREKQIVVAYGERLDLTPTEYKLLACLVENVDRVLSYQKLAREALEYQCSDKEARAALKTHLWRLRRKLKTGAGEESPIVNVRGKGYMIRP